MKESLPIFQVILCLFDLVIKYIDIIETYFRDSLINNNLPIFITQLLRIRFFKSYKLEQFV